MFKAGKTAQVGTDMKKYNLAILRISESRGTGSGQKRLVSRELLIQYTWATRRTMRTTPRESH